MGARWEHIVSASAKLSTAARKEKLLYFVMLRQMETPSPAMRKAYSQLAEAASAAEGWDLRTIILDWLEEEMRTLGQSESDVGPLGTQLMKAAVAVSNALGQ